MASFLNQTMDDKSTEPNIPYMVFEVLVAFFAVIGNALVILVFYRERRLRRRTNYYIVSLAIADLLVGLLGIPFAILASMGLPKNLYACLFTVSLLVVLCTISIFCLVAVSVDRYWAILYPMGYSRNVRTKTAIVIIGVCWVSGSLVGFLPLFGWHRGGERSEEKCLFTAVMDYNYLLFLYVATIIVPALMMAGFYGHIYSVVLRQLRQIVTMNPSGGFSRPTSGSGTMLRVLGAAQKREVKATQNLSIIVFFFIVCWFPLYTINCVQAFCNECVIPEPLTEFCIILSHVNSAVNPLLYAYHLRDFRAALKNLLYWMFGLKRDNVENCLQGTRFGSQNTLHNQRVNTLTRNYSSQSLQNTRVQQPLSDPSTTTTKLSCSSPLDAMISSVNSIHQTITSLGEENGQQSRKRMWTLTEVPSTCEEDSGTIPTGNGQVVKEYDDSCVQRRSVSGRSSGQVNSAYIEDGSILDYSEDEDVFALASVASTSSKIENCKCLRKEKEQAIICVTCSDSGVSAPSIFPSTKGNPELNITNTIPLPKKNCISESVCNLDLNILSHCSLVRETEINNKATDDNEETELSPRDERPVIISSIVNSAEREKEINYYPPSSPLRLSPLKIVGEFLFRTNSKKGSRLKNGTSSESCECVTNDGKSEDSESVNQRITSSRTQNVHEAPTYQ